MRTARDSGGAMSGRWRGFEAVYDCGITAAFTWRLPITLEQAARRQVRCCASEPALACGCFWQARRDNTLNQCGIGVRGQLSSTVTVSLTTRSIRIRHDRSIRIAINGYGRIGRSVLRALQESKSKCGLDVVAINEPAADLETMAYLTRYDSTHGVFPGTVGHEGNALVIDGQPIAVRHVRDPEAADWASLDVDILLECSGRFGARAQLQRFLDAGCPRVLVSQPGNSASDVDYTVVFGVNDEGLSGRERIVSNASCTTNAIVPVLDELDRAYGVQHAFLTTLHSVMNDQPMIDGYHHADLRRTRSAMQSIVPVATGLAQGVERLLPKLAGKVQAKAIRVPILNVSAIDLMVKLGRDVTPPRC